jgi:predicted deacetylase
MIVFRYDDYSKASPFSIEKKLVEAFNKDGLKITLGVIPCISHSYLDPSNQGCEFLSLEKVNFLREGVRDHVVEVAQHGFSHQKNNHARSLSEFSGLSLEEQLKKISEGAQYLNKNIDEPIDIFIPPWNSYDLNTLDALEQLGFAIISADIVGGATHQLTKIKYLPATTGLKKLRNALESARKSKDPHPLIVCLFHPYDFFEINEKMGGVRFEDFLKMIQFLKSQEDVQIVSFKDAAKMICDLGAKRYSANRVYYGLAEMLPVEWRYIIPDYGTYLSSGGIHIGFIVYVFMFYSFIFAISFVIALVIFKRLRKYL